MKRLGNGQIALEALYHGGYLHAWKGYSDNHDRYVYIYGPKLEGPRGDIYLARVGKSQMQNAQDYEFFGGFDGSGSPVWVEQDSMQPVFMDSNTSSAPLDSLSVQSVSVYFNKPLGRYIFVKSHGHAGQLGVFESQYPWGGWKTVYYNEKWGGFTDGTFLACGFPGKWISADGRTMWAAVSLHHGDLKNKPLGKYHDRLILLKATLTVTSASPNSVSDAAPDLDSETNSPRSPLVPPSRLRIPALQETTHPPNTDN